MWLTLTNEDGVVLGRWYLPPTMQADDVAKEIEEGNLLVFASKEEYLEEYPDKVG